MGEEGRRGSRRRRGWQGSSARVRASELEWVGEMVGMVVGVGAGVCCQWDREEEVVVVVVIVRHLGVWVVRLS